MWFPEFEIGPLQSLFVVSDATHVRRKGHLEMSKSAHTHQHTVTVFHYFLSNSPSMLQFPLYFRRYMTNTVLTRRETHQNKRN